MNGYIFVYCLQNEEVVFKYYNDKTVGASRPPYTPIVVVRTHIIVGTGVPTVRLKKSYLYK